jgi:hypothetical protein
MIRSKKRKTPAPGHWWNGIISLVGCVVLSGVVVGTISRPAVRPKCRNCQPLSEFC